MLLIDLHTMFEFEQQSMPTYNAGNDPVLAAVAGMSALALLHANPAAVVCASAAAWSVQLQQSSS